jgi:mycofactocin biosynthesis protein MftB
MSRARPPGFELDAAWELAAQVAVRPEPFGALLYHFGTRRLSFLKDPALLAVVRSLRPQPSARRACAAAGLDPAPAGTVASLARLAETGMIVRRSL